MSAALTKNPAPNESTELALASLLAHGRLYTKKPALPGFHVYYSRNPKHVAYNSLEDTEYTGAGIYMVGLLGETWKIGSFEKLAASYVIDATGEECEIEEALLLETEPPSDSDLSSCLAVRYRAGSTPPIVAARIPLSVESVVHCAEDGTCYMLHANRTPNSRGENIAHGEGDMVACSLAPTEGAGFGKNGSYQICGAVYRPKLSGAYIINGIIFSKTYEELAEM